MRLAAFSAIYARHSSLQLAMRRARFEGQLAYIREWGIPPTIRRFKSECADAVEFPLAITVQETQFAFFNVIYMQKQRRVRI